jgi:RNA polymerase sigma factor (sigma-70 family)
MEKLLNTFNVSSEEEIIDKIISGEIILFEILIRRYNPVLYKIAKAYGFNHQDAEDLMQDSHVTAYTQLRKFEKRSSYKTWLSKIMINKCLYKLSYGHFKNEITDSELITENVMHESSGETSTEKFIGNRELSKVLELSLQQIPVMYRTVFILREVEGFNVAETAELLSITPMNVKVRLNRAKAMLQKQLQQFYSSSELYEFNLIYCDKIVEEVFNKINSRLNEV